MEKLLKDKERELTRMIKDAKEQTRKVQLHRMEGQRTRGTGYKVGDLVRIKLDSNEIKKRGKKLAKRYSEKYMVIEVIDGGWTYRLKPYGRRGRNKIRHFNDLKDATIRRKEMESSDGEVLAEMESKTQSSEQEGGNRNRLRNGGTVRIRRLITPRKVKMENLDAKVINKTSRYVGQPGSVQQQRGYS